MIAHPLFKNGGVVGSELHSLGMPSVELRVGEGRRRDAVHHHSLDVSREVGVAEPAVRDRRILEVGRVQPHAMEVRVVHPSLRWPLLHLRRLRAAR
jgi:hypothetical protein